MEFFSFLQRGIVIAVGQPKPSDIGRGFVGISVTGGAEQSAVLSLNLGRVVEMEIALGEMMDIEEQLISQLLLSPAAELTAPVPLNHNLPHPPELLRPDVLLIGKVLLAPPLPLRWGVGVIPYSHNRENSSVASLILNRTSFRISLILNRVSLLKQTMGYKMVHFRPNVRRMLFINADEIVEHRHLDGAVCSGTAVG